MADAIIANFVSVLAAFPAIVANDERKFRRVTVQKLQKQVGMLYFQGWCSIKVGAEMLKR